MSSIVIFINLSLFVCQNLHSLGGDHRNLSAAGFPYRASSRHAADLQVQLADDPCAVAVLVIAPGENHVVDCAPATAGRDQ